MPFTPPRRSVRALRATRVAAVLTFRTARATAALATAALAVLGAATAAFNPAAQAVHAPAPAVTWTVQPAGAGGPDGRRWIERTLDPGQVVTEHLAVRNFSTARAVFALKAADGYLTDKGRFTMLPSDRKSADGGTWIAVPGRVSVPANATKVVAFTITVPPGATPGDHPAGIAASIMSGSGTVRVESRVGFRVLLRAGGTLRPAVAAGGVSATYQGSWSPLRSGALRLTYTASNIGNVRVEARGQVSVSGPFGANTRDRDTDTVELLPAGARTIEARLGGVWALGRLRTTVTLTPVIPGGAAGLPTTVTVTTWAVPWPQLAALAALVALVLLARHRSRRFKRMLDNARREGETSTASGQRG